MRIKTIFIIGITILLTIIIIQNADPVQFKVLFFETTISKLLMMLIVAFAGFIIGYLAGRPKRTRFTQDIDHGYDDDEHQDGTSRRGSNNTLSDEDRDYIS